MPNVLLVSSIVLSLFTLAAWLRHKKDGILPAVPSYVTDNVLVFAGVLIGWAGAS